MLKTQISKAGGLDRMYHLNECVSCNKGGLRYDRNRSKRQTTCGEPQI